MMKVVDKCILLILQFLLKNCDCLHYDFWYGQNHSTFIDKIDSYVTRNYIPVWVNGYANGINVRYAGIFRENPDNKAWLMYINMTQAGFQQRINELKVRKFLPIQASGYSVNGASRFAAIWNKNVDDVLWNIQWGKTAAQLQSELDEKSGAGYQVVSLSGYEYEGATRYVVIFLKAAGPQWVVRFGLNRNRLDEYLVEKTSSGYLPQTVQGYNIGGQIYYTVIMKKPNGAYETETALDPDISGHNLMERFRGMDSEGYQMESINGYIENSQFKYSVVWLNKPLETAGFINVSSLPKVTNNDSDSHMLSTSDQRRINELVQQFLIKWNIPGASVAIGKNEKLVYANGFGYADVENNELATPEHKFRIASISKPITSAAILKLAEDGFLSLDDFIFGSDGVLSSWHANSLSSGYQNAIKVKHLLRHTSGGWPNDNTDPLFLMEEDGKEELFEWTLRNQELISHVPGHSRKEELVPFEASYYRQGDPGDPYKINVPRMDSCAGWVMTASDLLKFLAHVDKFQSVPDILSLPSLNHMSTGSPANHDYGMGWGLQNGGPNWNHLGTIPGSSSLIKRIEMGKKSFVILLNSRKKGSAYQEALVQLMWDIMDGINVWPVGIEL